MPQIPLSEGELRHAVEVVEKVGGSKTKAAKILGIDRRRVGERLEMAARRGIAPGHFENGVAPGYQMGKVTVQRGPNGSVERTWERQSPDAERTLELLKAAAQAIMEGIPARKKVRTPAQVEIDLLTQYTFTDYHMNMLAWDKEGGANWNIEIAEETAMRAMKYLTDGAPRSNTAVVVIQGDWQHYDSMMPMTPTSGHVVDMAGRPQQGIAASIRVIVALVDMALQKHENVILEMCEGNHDIYTSMVLRQMFAFYYRNEPRVTVPDGQIPFYAIQWGQTALFFHHGHMKKWKDLPLTFAAMFPKIWGDTTKRYGNTGHYHHEKREEHSGIKMIQHPTMAANDSHGSRHGYMSQREMTAITFHKEFGRGSEIVVTPEMVGM